MYVSLPLRVTRDWGTRPICALFRRSHGDPASTHRPLQWVVGGEERSISLCFSLRSDFCQINTLVIMISPVRPLERLRCVRRTAQRALSAQYISYLIEESKQIGSTGPPTRPVPALQRDAKATQHSSRRSSLLPTHPFGGASATPQAWGDATMYTNARAFLQVTRGEVELITSR